MHIIPKANYTLDPTAGTLTLTDPYADIELAQIVQIEDLDTNDMIYDITRSVDVISVAGGVITYTSSVSASIAAGDDIRIVVDDVAEGTTTVGDGRQVVGTPGTAVALATSTIIKEVTVTSELTNTGVICVGGSTVIAASATQRGSPLYPGDSITLKASDLAEVFIDATVATDGVVFTYLI